MRRRLALAPPWVTLLLYTVLMVAALTVSNLSGGHGQWWITVVSACIGAAIAAPFLWFGQQRQRRAADSVTGPLTREQRWTVHRAAATGVLPDDPALHRPALDLARYRLADATRQRAAMTAISVAGFGLSVLLAVTDRSLWLAICAVLLAGLFARTLVYPGRQRRRVTQLEHATGAPGQPAHV